MFREVVGQSGVWLIAYFLIEGGLRKLSWVAERMAGVIVVFSLLKSATGS